MNLISVLIISTFSIVLLLFLILKLKIHPFVSLLIVSTFTALVSGISVSALSHTIEFGMGKTLGSISIIIALGSIIGSIIDFSGGNKIIADRFISFFKRKNIAIALSILGFFVAISIFFEAAVIMLMPIVYGISKKRSLPVIFLSMTLCITILIVHCILPPHPSAIFASKLLNVDISRTIFFGVPISISVSMFMVCFFMKYFLKKKFFVFSSNKNINNQENLFKISFKNVTFPDPNFILVIGLMLTPMFLMIIASIANITINSSSIFHSIFSFLGIPYVALLIDVMLCFYFLKFKCGIKNSMISDIFGKSLSNISGIILITGAGGVFSNVLMLSDIGPTITKNLQHTEFPILFIGFLVAMFFRVAQGPTTSAVMTASGIIAPIIKESSLNFNQVTLITLSMSAGGMVLSHVNDPGFWIVTRMNNLSVIDGLKTWTLFTTIAGFFMFFLILIIWNFV